MEETVSWTPQRALPQGAITFLFTDIEGSTRLLQLLGDDYVQVLEAHHRLLRASFSRHDGVEIDTQGDAFFVVFGSADHGVRAAVDGQRALRSYAWPRATPVSVRMGLHTGRGVIVEDNYVGIDVHRAARICNAAHGGQVILSRATHRQLSPVVCNDVVFTDLGLHRLKDLDEPIHILQAATGDLPRSFPPLRSVRPPTNLRRYLGALVGRERERAELRSLLTDPAVRLVTLTGPGGTGKTRLCVEVALDALEAFPNGVWFVDLTMATTYERVAVEAATQLSIPLDGSRNAIDTLREHFAEKRCLLVLDNFEQALAGADAIVELLRGCPNLSIVVTSRSLLSVRGEVEYELAPLAVPRGPATRAEAARSGAVQLFVARAAQVRTGFTLTDANASAVADICRLLDGLPLALELAAARVKVMDPHELLRRLNKRLAVLTAGSRDAPARHQTLRTTMDWSYDLLPPEDRRLFSEIAVFSGASTMEAIEHVVGQETDVLNRLTALVDHSLIRRQEVGGELRFVMLQTVREYALELLEALRNRADIRNRHAAYYLALAEGAGDGAAGGTDLTAEHDNLRTALDWWLTRAEVEPETYGEPALRLAAALGQFWYTHGLAVEGSRWLERALSLDVPPPRDVRATVLRLLGVLLEQRRELQRADVLLDEALTYFRRKGDASQEAACLNSLGVVARARGDFRTAKAYLTESSEIRRRLSDSPGLSASLGNLAIVAIDMGDYVAAKELLHEAMQLDHDRGNHWGAAITALNLGVAHLESGEVEEADQLVRQAMEVLSVLGDLDGVAESLEALAGSAAAQQRLARAARLGGAADALRRSLGIPLTDVDGRRWERWLAAPRQELGERGFAVAWEEGAAMTTEQAVGYAKETARTQ